MPADTLTNLAAVAVGGIVLWGLWQAAQPKAVFEILFLDGTIQVKTGKVLPGFLQVVEEIATASGVSEMTVRGYSNGRRIRLAFSDNVSRECQQQLRNWWAEHGWAAPKTVRSQRCS